jgi:hypothetical protein
MKTNSAGFNMKPAFCLILWLVFLSCSQNNISRVPTWPEIKKEHKPWTRWWWMGNIVSPATLTETMEEYSKTGLGGLEITPIYGVRGYENQFIDYLSPRFMDMLEYTLKEGRRLDLGIDMAGSSGWPFGGPWVTPADACKNMVRKKYTVKGGQKLEEKIECFQEPMVHAIRKHLDISAIEKPVSANKNLQELALTQVRYPEKLTLQSLMAFSSSGDAIELAGKVNENGSLDWVAPAGDWTLFAVFQGWHGKLVERAGPGGEGDVIDHFSATAVDNYFTKFDTVFKNRDISGLRAFFNDSYEVDDAAGQADWTPGFFDQFLKRRGYDLKQKLPALFGDEDEETNMRVLSDYRETISDLILENYTQRWRSWANRKNLIIRNQSHGSPGSILDLYAASDIPETEGRNIQKIKFASSAAHVSGKNLASSESATLLNEHFISPLSHVKPVMDTYLLGGVNHVFYHGTTFSPKNEAWPGWLFYAAVHFDPVNSFWTDFGQLNLYIARCQSLLQEGKPDNDILVYYPIFDEWSAKPDRRGILVHIGGGAGKTGAGETADFLLKNGYSYDFISDLQIENLQVKNGIILTGGNQYQTLVIPKCRFMPVSTFRKITGLIQEGATILFDGDEPVDIPGLGKLDERREQYRQLKQNLKYKPSEMAEIEVAKYGRGKACKGQVMGDILEFAGIRKERMVDSGLSFIRRKTETGTTYFILNKGKVTFDGWTSLEAEASSVAVFNPMTGETGTGKIRHTGGDDPEVYLQLAPGESCLLKTCHTKLQGKGYGYIRVTGIPEMLKGKWKVDFIAGGPTLPGSLETDTLVSWTEFDSDGVRDFSGTAEYTCILQKPESQADGWVLDLGEVCESAMILLNGREAGTLIMAPYRLVIPSEELDVVNTLKVRVSNLMANRILYIDRHQVNWKKFYNANIPGRLPENRGPDGYFTAKNWTPGKSGLIGPVTIIPFNYKKVN